MTNNPVYHFFHTPGNPGPLILRLATAGIFFFHGTQKALGWFGGAGWTATIERWTSMTGFGFPDVLAPLVMISELAITLALFLGFFTRLAGFGVAIIMSGALLVAAKNSQAFGDLEFPFMIWTAGLTLLFIGGGALSLDRAISKNLLPIVG
ncbi:MAG: DoxX family protein [Terrimicrobiaceae bacterium]